MIINKIKCEDCGIYFPPMQIFKYKDTNVCQSCYMSLTYDYDGTPRK